MNNRNNTENRNQNNNQNNNQIKKQNSNEMKNENNRYGMKKNNDQIADVPNPPVPNRAHTELKTDNKSSNSKNSK